MRVLLVGVYPPPFGGVSVLIQRLQAQLEERGVDCWVLALQTGREAPARKVIYGKNILHLMGYLVTTKADVTHDFLFFPYLWQHKARMVAYFLASLASRKKWVVTLAAGTIPGIVGRMAPLERRLVLWLLGKARHIICINQEILEAMTCLGLSRERLSCDPFFLPPLASDPRFLPPAVEEFCFSHWPLLVSTGWFERLYNLHLVLGAVRELRKEFPRLGLVMAVGSRVPEPNYKAEMEKLVVKDGLEGSVIFVSDLPQTLPLYEKAQVFVRTSSVDGECVSLREALWVGVPAVASDTGYRPRGVLLFRKDDGDDLVQKLRQALLGAGPPPAIAQEVRRQVRQTLEKLLRVYSAATGQPPSQL